MINELTFPLANLTHGRKTDVKKGVVNNRDAALLILAANGGVMSVNDVKILLRGWRPLSSKLYDNTGKIVGHKELRFQYLFNSYYGISYDRDRDCEHAKTSMIRHYSVAAIFHRPKRGLVTISSYGRKRLADLIAELRNAGRPVHFN